MSDLNKQTIQAISKLCRIDLSETEVDEIAISLKRVLDFSEQLSEVDVSELSPYSHVEEQGPDSLREDRVFRPLSREVFLKNAPDQVGGMIRVPPVMKQNP